MEVLYLLLHMFSVPSIAPMGNASARLLMETDRCVLDVSTCSYRFVSKFILVAARDKLL